MNDHMLKYKPDYREARERMTDWWEGRPTDRAIIQISAPRPPAQPTVQEYIHTIPDRYITPATVLNNVDHMLERAYFGGENFPTHFVYLGPIFYVAYFGCEPRFEDHTTWYEPCFNSIEDFLERMTYDPQNHWWQLTKQITQASMEHACGAYDVTATPGVAALVDMLAELVGKEELLITMAEDGALLRRACERLEKSARAMMDEMYALVNGEELGTVDWMKIWCHKKVLTTQCDYSVMISPQMFEEFVIPDIESTYDLCDYGIYHLDGEEQIRHLDLLLAVEKLRLIQWVPSTRQGQPDYKHPRRWMDLFKRIQAAGKSVLIYCEPADIPELLNKLDPRLLILNTWAESEEAATNVLRNAERMGCSPRAQK